MRGDAAQQPLEAVILAGGRGSRLRPATDYVPKPLVPVAGRPILEWQAMYLRRFGVRDIVISAGYRAEQMQDYVESRGGFGARVRFSVERSPLGTGGAIKKAGAMARGRSFLVLNGDIMTDLDLRPMLAAPDCVAAVQMRSKFGRMALEGSRVAGFEEKGQLPGMWMNAGIYHLSRSVLRDLPARGSIEETVFPKYARASRLSAVKYPKARWFSIDSHKDIEECAAAAGSMIPG